MSITVEEKARVMKDFATKEGDTGSPEVQVAIRNVPMRPQLAGQPDKADVVTARDRMGRQMPGATDIAERRTHHPFPKMQPLPATQDRDSDFPARLRSIRKVADFRQGKDAPEKGDGDETGFRPVKPAIPFGDGLRCHQAMEPRAAVLDGQRRVMRDDARGIAWAQCDLSAQACRTLPYHPAQGRSRRRRLWRRGRQRRSGR